MQAIYFRCIQLEGDAFSDGYGGVWVFVYVGGGRTFRRRQSYVAFDRGVALCATIKRTKLHYSRTISFARMSAYDHSFPRYLLRS